VGPRAWVKEGSTFDPCQLDGISLGTGGHRRLGADGNQRLGLLRGRIQADQGLAESWIVGDHSFELPPSAIPLPWISHRPWPARVGFSSRNRRAVSRSPHVRLTCELPTQALPKSLLSNLPAIRGWASTVEQA